VIDVGLHPEHHLAGAVLAVDHRLELLANRLLVLVPVRARFRRVLQLREGLPGTRTGVRAAEFDKLARVLVVGVDAVTRFQDLARFEPEVVDGVEDLVVGVQVGSLGLGVGVVEPADKGAVVALCVGADDRRHPGVADVPGAVRVRRDAHLDVVVRLDVREVGQRVVIALVLALEFFEALGCQLGEAVAAFFGGHPVDALDDRRDDPRNLVAVLAKLGVLAHQRPHDRTDLRLAVVFDRVEERVGLGGLAHAVFQIVVHYRNRRLPE